MADKKKVGRPLTKLETMKTINIAVPVSLLDKVNIAKLKYQNNLTKYINHLIEQDLEKNFENYQALAELMNEN